jgi:predicted PhzF superfamily epimerase YddE/YHI9
VLARYFFTKQGGGVAEDPGTGSACANLGGWLMATGASLPARYAIDQGAAVDRPSRLRLAVGSDGAIQVGGRVIEIGRGPSPSIQSARPCWPERRHQGPAWAINASGRLPA